MNGTLVPILVHHFREGLARTRRKFSKLLGRRTLCALEPMCLGSVAEGVGFEPTIRFPVYTLSKRAP